MNLSTSPLQQTLLHIVQNIWLTYDDSKTLDLVENYYHKPTGLHNEGVWHNCVMMANYYLLLEQQEEISARSSEESAISGELFCAMCKVSKSLVELNYDSDCNLFKQRTETEYWSHENAKNNSHLLQLYQRTEHNEQVFKLISNTIALLSYSLLSDANAKYAELVERYDMRVTTIDLQSLAHQILTSFFNEQEGAYSTKIKLPASNPYNRESHFKAADHALLLIALIVMESKCIPLPETVTQSYCDLKQLLRSSLLNKFGFRHPDTIKSYINPEGSSDDKEKYRFLWQDVWVLLALALTTSGASDDVALQQLVRNIVDVYSNEDNNLFYCEPKPSLYSRELEKRTITHGTLTEHVYISPQTNFFYNCYTGDNALLYGFLDSLQKSGKLQWSCSDKKDAQRKDFVDRFLHKAFFHFIETQFKLNDDIKKLNISEVMRKSALWANSEFVFSFTFLPASFAKKTGL